MDLCGSGSGSGSSGSDSFPFSFVRFRFVSFSSLVLVPMQTNLHSKNAEVDLSPDLHFAHPHRVDQLAQV